MTPVNLQIDSANSAWAIGLAASLPVSVNRTGSEAADLTLMDARADWPERLLGWIEAGQRRFLVIDPPVTSASALAKVIEAVARTGSEIVISETHANNPAFAPFREALGGPWSAGTLTGTGTIGLADLVLQQLRLARRVGLGQFSIINSLALKEGVLATLEAVLENEPIILRLSLARSGAVAPHHRLVLHSPTRTASIEVSSEPDARPATSFRAEQEFGQNLPMIYENAHRAALRAFADGAVQSSDLAEWSDDASLAMAIVRFDKGDDR